jgi:hypothetical protein
VRIDSITRKRRGILEDLGDLKILEEMRKRPLEFKKLGNFLEGGNPKTLRLKT